MALVGRLYQALLYGVRTLVEEVDEIVTFVDLSNITHVSLGTTQLTTGWTGARSVVLNVVSLRRLDPALLASEMTTDAQLKFGEDEGVPADLASCALVVSKGIGGDLGGINVDNEPRYKFLALITMVVDSIAVPANLTDHFGVLGHPGRPTNLCFHKNWLVLDLASRNQAGKAQGLRCTAEDIGYRSIEPCCNLFAQKSFDVLAFESSQVRDGHRIANPIRNLVEGQTNGDSGELTNGVNREL